MHYIPSKSYITCLSKVIPLCFTNKSIVIGEQSSVNQSMDRSVLGLILVFLH